jgi:hypothetical protein
LGDPNAGLWAVEVAGSSGHPGSPRYAEQVEPWSAGDLHYITLKGDIDGSVLTLEPK